MTTSFKALPDAPFLPSHTLALHICAMRQQEITEQGFFAHFTELSFGTSSQPAGHVNPEHVPDDGELGPGALRAGGLAGVCEPPFTGFDRPVPLTV
jgi:hypothetical protein